MSAPESPGQEVGVVTRSARALAILALGVLASSAQGAELFRRGDLAVELSGSIRGIGILTRGTSQEDYQEAVLESLVLPDASTLAILGDPELLDLLEGIDPGMVRGLADSLVEPVCLLAASFEECPAFHEVGRLRVWQSLVRVRTRVDLQISPSLSGRVEYDHELVTGRLDTLESQGFGPMGPEPLLPFQEEIWNFGLGGESRGFWRHALYRGWLNWETERFQVILGRQRIPWGVGRLWNPIDRFNPIAPLAIESEESAGIDAVVATWFAYEGAALDAVYSPGDDGDDPSYALRLHGLVSDTDYSLMAGVFDDANTIGATVERNLGGMAVHVEAVYADPDARDWPVGRSRPRDLPSFWQVVVSLDTNIDVGKGIYALIEHLYNGNALGLGRGRAGSLLPFFEATMTPPDELPPVLRGAFPGPYVQPISADRFGGSRVVTLARHQTGATLGYDLTPTLRGDLLVIYDWNGHSSAIAPQFSYTPRGDLEVTLGLQIFTGRRASQYGQAENLAFLTIEYFF
jgi:hypothetical protein